jgi:hypothetical protein
MLSLISMWKLFKCNQPNHGLFGVILNAWTRCLLRCPMTQRWNNCHLYLLHCLVIVLQLTAFDRRIDESQWIDDRKVPMFSNFSEKKKVQFSDTGFAPCTNLPIFFTKLHVFFMNIQQYVIINSLIIRLPNVRSTLKSPILQAFPPAELLNDIQLRSLA